MSSQFSIFTLTENVRKPEVKPEGIEMKHWFEMA